MGQLIYPSTREIKGPWLLKKEDFEELEKVFIEIENYLEKSLSIEIQETVHTENEKENLSEKEIIALIEKAKKRYSFEKKSKTYMIISEDETRLKDSSIRELLKDKSLRDLKPSEFYIFIENGYNNTIKFEVSDKYFGSLKYDLNCYDSKIKDEIQFEIDNWIDKRIPSRVLKFWSNWGIAFAAYSFIAILIVLLFIFIPEYQSYKEVLTKQADELIKNGITSENNYKAINLLLKLQTNYVPDNFSPILKPKGSLIYKMLVLSIFIFTISIIKPKTTIGLGKRKIKEKIYRHWLKIVVAILTGLIINPFWSIIVDWFWAR
ncbi:MAG TPA: hypothetical protein VN698_09825 [Bacteroidia bacterium]|nr:hypothetical protein [Bacteroidia bacterium]